MTFTLDDKLRKHLEDAMQAMRELESRRPACWGVPGDKYDLMTRRYLECKSGIETAIDNAAAIR
jgi:hypothetical protein